MADRGNLVSSYTNPAFEDGRFPDSGEDCIASIKTVVTDTGHASVVVRPISDEMEEYQGVFSSSGSSDALFLQLKTKYWALCALVVAHIALTGYIDPLYTTDKLIQLILYFNSLYIKLSRYDLYFSEFRILYVTFALELALMITVKAYQGVQLYSQASYLAPWSDQTFSGLWVTQRILLLLFWVATITYANAAFEPRLYDINYITGLSRPTAK